MPAPPDKVQLQKWETSGGGGDAEDESGFFEPLEPNEDAPEVQGIYLQPPKPSTTRDKLVYFTRDSSGNMILRDNVDQTERSLSTLLAGGGITEGQHETLDTLVHWLSETHYLENVRDENGKVTNAIAWTDSGKTTKVRELTVTRSSGKVSQIDVIQYNGSGTEIQRMTGVITRTSGKVSSIQWTETVT